MGDPKATITVHGTTVTLYLSPRDPNTTTITALKPAHARRIADTIRSARASGHVTVDSPLYAGLALWAWTGTTALAEDSWGKYRPLVARAIQEVGGTTLGSADKAWYQRYHALLDQAAVTHTHLVTIETMLGSFATWCDDSNAYVGPRPTGTGHRNLHLDYRGRARARRDEQRPPIELRDCPTWDYALGFGEILAEVAVERWGPEYACWRHAPTVQFLTGCRFAELPVLADTNFKLDDPKPHVRVLWQYADGATEPGNPNRKPTKDKRKRQAKLYGGAAGFLAPIVADASTRPGGLLLPLPHGLAGGTRALHRLYEAAIERYEERHGKTGYTSHWFRHAYASYALAPLAQGGYAASDREVADSLGHKRTDLVQERYHKTTESPLDLHHLPGEVATAEVVDLRAMNRPGSDGGSGYWFPTPAGSGCWAA
jgi:hypothetical protein